jgi:probable rRNA maturation factor
VARSHRRASPAPAAAARVPLQLEVLDRARARLPRDFVRRVVRTTLAFAGRPEVPVSLLLTDDAEIAQLHAEHLDDPTPTDVMSFAVDGGAELVVSVETARRVAREHGHAVRAELALYIVHGLLHVLGYDDVRPRDRARMRQAERDVLQQLALRVHVVDG